MLQASMMVFKKLGAHCFSLLSWAAEGSFRAGMQPSGCVWRLCLESPCPELPKCSRGAPARHLL